MAENSNTVVASECTWHNCSITTDLIEKEGSFLCSFHSKGGVFSTDQLLDQYAIIEEDFITILKYLPLEKENLSVKSPRFSDILIRSCVGIEIFFREWLNDYKLSHESKIDKIRAKAKPVETGRDYIRFDDFHPIFSKYLTSASLKTRQLETCIYPFNGWTKRTPPAWWTTYNNVKHHRVDKGNVANMETALNALGALFLLHCTQIDSLTHLYKYSSSRLISKSWTMLNFIKTPMESKRYLFLYKIDSASPSHERSRES